MPKYLNVQRRSSSHFSDSAASLARAHHPNTTATNSRCSTHGAGDRNSHERLRCMNQELLGRDARPLSQIKEFPACRSPAGNRMSEPADIAVRTPRFTQAVRDFKLPSPSRHAKLVPLKEGIVELRQKGASLRLIRELLATVDVAVGTDTIIETISPPTCGRSGFHCCDGHHFPTR